MNRYSDFAGWYIGVSDAFKRCVCYRGGIGTDIGCASAVFGFLAGMPQDKIQKNSDNDHGGTQHLAH